VFALGAVECHKVADALAEFLKRHAGGCDPMAVTVVAHAICGNIVRIVLVGPRSAVGVRGYGRQDAKSEQTCDDQNVRNKLSRGAFTAAYLLQCLEALGLKELRL
jgi:hypothetical protein